MPPVLVRAIATVLWVILAVGPTLARDAPAALGQFAATVGLRDIDGFVETIISLRERGALPARYITKAEAARAGWRPGDNLCRVAPGRAIGGDRFGNRERRLPDAPGRTWREADLDAACGRRGARRLVWSNDGLIFVTLDHYETFRAVPR